MPSRASFFSKNRQERTSGADIYGGETLGSSQSASQSRSSCSGSSAVVSTVVCPVYQAEVGFCLEVRALKPLTYRQFSGQSRGVESASEPGTCAAPRNGGVHSSRNVALRPMNAGASGQYVRPGAEFAYCRYSPETPRERERETFYLGPFLKK